MVIPLFPVDNRPTLRVPFQSASVSANAVPMHMLGRGPIDGIEAMTSIPAAIAYMQQEGTETPAPTNTEQGDSTPSKQDIYGPGELTVSLTVGLNCDHLSVPESRQ